MCDKAFVKGRYGETL